MKYQKNIKITVSKAEQEAIKDVLTILDEMDENSKMDAYDICHVLDAISNKSKEIDVCDIGDVEIDYEEGTIF